MAAQDPERAERFVWRLTKFLPTRWHTRVARAAAYFVDGLGAFKGRRRVFLIFATSVAMWLADVAMYYVVGRAYDIQIGVGGFFLLEGIGNLALAVPATAAGIGTFDYLTLIAAKGIDVPTDKATAYVLTMHALTVIPITLLGAALVRPAFPRLFRRHTARRRAGLAPGALELRREEGDLFGLFLGGSPRLGQLGRAPGRVCQLRVDRPAERARGLELGGERGRMRLAPRGELVGDELARRQRHAVLEPVEDVLLEPFGGRRERVPEDQHDLGAPVDEGVVGQSDRQYPLRLPPADECVEPAPERTDLPVRRGPPFGEDDERLSRAHEADELAEIGGCPCRARAPEGVRSLAARDRLPQDVRVRAAHDLPGARGPAEHLARPTA